jgi:2,3-bisphosphoglycerate-dependent phosphoglycerate mutase
MSKLVLVRHGESRWNLDNRFTGWVDVPLSANGIREAQATAKRLKRMNFDVAFTSRLTRAQSTLLIILSEQNRTGVFQHVGEGEYYKWTCSSNRCTKDDIPIYPDKRLNERYYGDLQGLDKAEANRVYGKQRVFLWRRGFTNKPPGGESLKMTFDRVYPYFSRTIMRRVRMGENVLLAAHGNTLRAIMMHLQRIKSADIPYLDLPQGKPIIYEYKKGRCVCMNPEDFTFKRPLR